MVLIGLLAVPPQVAEQVASEDPTVHLLLLVITGLLTLSSGALGGLLVDRIQNRRHRRS